MNAKTKAQPTRVPETDFFYTADSLSFARRLLSELEGELKEKAKQLTFAAGRNTVTEEDMRQAADDILGMVDGEVDDPSADDA